MFSNCRSLGDGGGNRSVAWSCLLWAIKVRGGDGGFGIVQSHVIRIAKRIRLVPGGRFLRRFPDEFQTLGRSQQVSKNLGRFGLFPRIKKLVNRGGGGQVKTGGDFDGRDQFFFQPLIGIRAIVAQGGSGQIGREQDSRFQLFQLKTLAGIEGSVPIAHAAPLSDLWIRPFSQPFDPIEKKIANPQSRKTVVDGSGMVVITPDRNVI